MNVFTFLGVFFEQENEFLRYECYYFLGGWDGSLLSIVKAFFEVYNVFTYFGVEKKTSLNRKMLFFF